MACQGITHTHSRLTGYKTTQNMRPNAQNSNTDSSTTSLTGTLERRGEHAFHTVRWMARWQTRCGVDEGGRLFSGGSGSTLHTRERERGSGKGRDDKGNHHIINMFPFHIIIFRRLSVFSHLLFNRVLLVSVNNSQVSKLKLKKISKFLNIDIDFPQQRPPWDLCHRHRQRFSFLFLWKKSQGIHKSAVDKTEKVLHKQTPLSFPYYRQTAIRTISSLLYRAILDNYHSDSSKHAFCYTFYGFIMDIFADFLMLYTGKLLKTVALTVLMKQESDQEASWAWRGAD